ncbi:uncharacterized protein FIBRA_07714 [Fibroporia radiculosa]|uniref:SAP domain-containing protein n=1 Tax=Fibroporia radiculosa TaxID=599839 RepID=J4GFD1_9APHY|nr:uncharacterized protein FIBRA_07714 [Fibroporia radiculosa]CCM05493.1 predicted protein [Fibroporia radiculosa]
MSTTTQILFNSPALHSLKREQLVKLCKIHSIKASGKNTELIERLKQRAQELPKDDEDGHGLASFAEGGDGGFRVQMPRPSEQWEVVMDDIAEVPESSSLKTISSKGSYRSMPGEFGTGNSKTSSISSSIKALANSLGIKHAVSTKSTSAQNVATTPLTDEVRSENAEPLQQTNHFPSGPQNGYDTDGDVSMSAPVPGSPSRPGMPAPDNARLSMGQGLTTTVRLISTAATNTDFPTPPRLQPFQTTFDLKMYSPGANASPGQRMTVWPASPSNQPQRLYPAIPVEDYPAPRPADVAPQATPNDAMDVDMPGGISTPANQATPARTTRSAGSASKPKSTPMPVDVPDLFSPMRPTADAATKAPARLPIPRSEPFLFGSPLPRHSLSNKEFDKAAASVLEEMNKRLAEAGVPSAQRAPVPFDGFFGAVGKPQAQTDSADRFAKAHDDVFSKMDSITTHYAARRGAGTGSGTAVASKKRKSDVLGVGPAPGAKRKSSAAGARVISNGVRKKMGVPGGFGEEDEDEDGDEDSGDRRSSKRIRVTGTEDVHKGKRVSIAPKSGLGDADVDELQKQREREAIRKKLDANKARRRSSRGRVSIGGKPPVKAKTSRFGFLASAKSIVKNVWNMGAGSSSATKSSTASSIPVAKPTLPTKTAPETRPAASTQKTVESARSRVLSGSHNMPKPPTSSVATKRDSTINSTKSSIATIRSPIPSFANPATAAKPGSNTANSRTSVSGGAGTSASRTHSRNDSLTSVGTRTSLATGSRTAVSSIGTRKSTTNASATGTANSRMTIGDGQDAENSSNVANSLNVRKRTSSLMAPTASSLAKTTNGVKPAGTAGRLSALPVVAEQPTKLVKSKRYSVMPSTATKGALDPTANSLRSPPPSRIFADPLTTTTFSSPSSLPTPARLKPSLDAVATAIMGTSSGIPKLAVPPKPKALIARKPRISRSRVIAKLGAQRATGQPTPLAPSVVPASRTRSSMGARKSLGGVRGGRSSTGGEAVKTAAKRRARQSEYARRRSRVVAADRKSAGGGGRDPGADSDH